jgi:hypothetical protein
VSCPTDQLRKRFEAAYNLADEGQQMWNDALAEAMNPDSTMTPPEIHRRAVTATYAHKEATEEFCRIWNELRKDRRERGFELADAQTKTLKSLLN